MEKEAAAEEEEKKEETESWEDEELGLEAFEKALDWTVSGKYKHKMEGRQMVAEMIRASVLRAIKKVTMSQTVVDFIQDEEEWCEFEEDEQEEGDLTDEELNWNKMMREESEQRSSSMQQAAVLRARLVAKAYQLKDRGVVLNIRNLLLQRKVAEISIGRRSSEKPKAQGLRAFSAMGVDPKLRCREALMQYSTLRKTLDDLSARYEKELKVLREYHVALEERIDDETDKLQAAFKTEVATLRCGLTGKAMQGEELLTLIERKLQTVKKEHSRYVHTSQRLRDMSRRIATLEMFGDHTKLEDYEQLFEDNQKLEERIEERGDVIVSLREKAVHELQEAAHMRDMMHGTEEDIDALVLQLDAVDERLARGRDAVAKAKRRRDEIRRRTKRLVLDLELLAYPELLSHFQTLCKLTAHAHAWLRSLMSACTVQEECILRVRTSLLELSRQYRGIIPDSVLRMLQLQTRHQHAPAPPAATSRGSVDADSDQAELEQLPSRFNFSF